MRIYQDKELDLQALAPKLTWIDKAALDRTREREGRPWEYETLPLGAVLKGADGFYYLIGDAKDNGEDFGCGCCSDDIKFVAIAFLSELFGD